MMTVMFGGIYDVIPQVSSREELLLRSAEAETPWFRGCGSAGCGEMSVRCDVGWVGGQKKISMYLSM
jgi:hypothetical protein